MRKLRELGVPLVPYEGSFGLGSRHCHIGKLPHRAPRPASRRRSVPGVALQSHLRGWQVLVTLDIVSDMAYAWEAINDYTELMRARIQRDT